MTKHDVVITGGEVLDGTGADPVAADVAIRDGVITQVALREAGARLTGREVIDADGRLVAPGFIDLHSHADFSLQGWPAAHTQLAQGVTTLVTGNCGFSPFPVADLDELRAATAFFDPDLSWTWHAHDGFAVAVDAAGPAVNIAPQVGHSSVRLAAMGGVKRPADDAALGRMATLVTEAADSGVLGFSTGLVYPPGAYGDEAEVRHLVVAAARSGLLYSTHIRNESAYLHEAIAEAVSAAESCGARLQISHLKAAGPRHHGTVAGALDQIDEAAERGVDVAADVYPYAASSTTLTTRLPAWTLDGGPAALLRRLEDPDQRLRILDELRGGSSAQLSPDRVMIADLGPGPYRDDAGRTLAQVAAREDVDDAEATLRILEGHQAAVAVVLHGMSEDDVRTVLRHPRVAVASDGWVMKPDGNGCPHPRNFGTFPRVLGRYVRELGVVSLPEAVRKMTSLPASRLGLADRGVLRPGAAADVVVFDPQTVADRSTYADPWQLSTGVDDVVVAGRVAVRNGTPTGVRAGRVLRR